MDEMKGIALLLSICLFLNISFAQNITTGTTGTSTTGTTGLTPNSTTTGNDNPNDCTQHTTCGDCIGETNCIWCESNSNCMSGTWYGPSAGSSKCHDWRWEQCQANGRYVLLGAVGVAVIIIGGLTLCIVCCCCCRSRKSKPRKSESFVFHDTEKDPLLSESGHPVTDKRRAELAKKYNLPSSRSVNNNEYY